MGAAPFADLTLLSSKHSVAQLKDACRTRGLKVGGNKGALIARLEEHDASSSGARLTPQSDCERALCPELAEKGARELEESFKSAARGEDGGEDNGNGGNDDDDSDNDDDDNDSGSKDGGGIPAAMDIETPGSSPQRLTPHFSDAPYLPTPIVQSRLPRPG
ncbi:hypothetical protein EDB86DRAFT_417908 [Lactarius hatsudake]|nr:hypothetical protein EDB86DRAFT_417908 [Lactarius hatsudake]